MAFNPFSVIKNIGNKVVSGVKTAATAVKNVLTTPVNNTSNVNKTANISQAVPQPVTIPSPAKGSQGSTQILPGGKTTTVPSSSQPIYPTPTGAPISSSPASLITPPPIVNPDANRNYSPVPTMSTEYGQAFTNPQGQIELVSPNVNLPGGQSSIRSVPLPASEAAPGQQPYTPLNINSRSSGLVAKSQAPAPYVDPQLKYLGPYSFNPETTGYNYLGQLTTGEGGFGGQSAGQFGGGAGAFGIAGGASLLPGSLGSTGRSAGFNWMSFLPNKDKDKKKKEQIVDTYDKGLLGSLASFGKNLITPQFGGTQPKGSISDITKNAAQGLGNVADAANRIPILSPFFNAASGIQNASDRIAPTIGAAGSGLVGGVMKAGQLVVPRGSEISNRLGENANYLFNQAGQLLSNSDRRAIDTASTSPKYPSLIDKYLKPEVPGSNEFLGGNTDQRFVSSQDKFSTKSAVNNYTSSKISDVINIKNSRDAEYAQQLRGQLDTGVIDFLSQNSAEIFGQQLTPEQIALGATQDPTISQAYAKYRSEAEAGAFDPVTGNPYMEEYFDFESAYENTQLAELQKQLSELSAQDPFFGKTSSDLRAQYMQEEGVLSLKAQRDSIQSAMDAIRGTYEQIATEIKDDPDFSKRLKGKRLEFLDNKQLDNLRSFQRDLDRVIQQITDKEAIVAEKMNDIYKDYTIFQDRRNSIQNNIDKLLANADKASDNARAAISALVSNPSLAEGITDAEIAYIYKTGNFPTSLVKKISTSTVGKGDAYSNVTTKEDASGNVTMIGIDKKTNQPVVIGTFPGIGTPQKGSGTGEPNLAYKDVVDPITGITKREYFYEPTAPGSMTFGPSGELTGADKKNLFLKYLGNVHNAKGKSALESEARAEGIDLNDADVKKAIDNAKSGLFGKDTPTFSGTYSDYLVNYASGGQGGQAGGGRQVTVISPDGRSAVMNLNPQQIQEAVNNGYRVQ